VSISEFIPFRVLIFAIAAGATSLVSFVYIPPLLRPGIPVSHFRPLPYIVASDLTRRACNIVRVNNAISEDFAGTGQRDWAVLCQRDNRASLLIYPAAVESRPYSVPMGPDSWTTRRVHVGYASLAGIMLIRPTAPRACIEDGVGMGSSIYCYLDGAWAVLAGAD
jgi:hypothetical protein